MRKVILIFTVLFFLFSNSLKAQKYDPILDNFFPLKNGFWLGKTTINQAELLGFKKNNKTIFLNGIYTRDIFKDDNIIDYYTGTNKILQIGLKNGHDHSTSYNEWITYFEKIGCSIEITKEPKIKEYEGRKTLSAEFNAISPSKNTSFEFSFDYGNKNGEGYSIHSKNTKSRIAIFTQQPTYEESKIIAKKNINEAMTFIKNKCLHKSFKHIKGTSYQVSYYKGPKYAVERAEAQYEIWPYSISLSNRTLILSSKNSTITKVDLSYVTGIELKGDDVVLYLKNYAIDIKCHGYYVEPDNGNRLQIYVGADASRVIKSFKDLFEHLNIKVKESKY